MSPDRAVVRLAQARVLDVLGLVPSLAEPARECRRQLGIDQELYVASDSTAWST